MSEKKINCLTCEFGTLIGHTCKKNVPMKDRVKSGVYYVCHLHEHEKQETFYAKFKAITKRLNVRSIMDDLFYSDKTGDVKFKKWGGRYNEKDLIKIRTGFDPAKPDPCSTGSQIFVGFPPSTQKLTDIGSQKEDKKYLFAGDTKHIVREGQPLCGIGLWNGMKMMTIEEYHKQKNIQNIDATVCPECLRFVYKSNKGKLSYDEIPFEWFTILARAFEYGKRLGYAKHSWKNVPAEDYYDAHMRHLKAHREGEFIDKDSGYPHIEHAIWNLNAYYARSRDKE